MLVSGRTIRGFGLPSGAEYLVLGVVVGPHALGVLTRSTISGFEPIFVLGASWLALVAGIGYGVVGARGGSKSDVRWPGSSRPPAWAPESRLRSIRVRRARSCSRGPSACARRSSRASSVAKPRATACAGWSSGTARAGRFPIGSRTWRARARSCRSSASVGSWRRARAPLADLDDARAPRRHASGSACCSGSSPSCCSVANFVATRAGDSCSERRCSPRAFRAARAVPDGDALRDGPHDGDRFAPPARDQAHGAADAKSRCSCPWCSRLGRAVVVRRAEARRDRRRGARGAARRRARCAGSCLPSCCPPARPAWAEIALSMTSTGALTLAAAFTLLVRSPGTSSDVVLAIAAASVLLGEASDRRCCAARSCAPVRLTP